MSKRRTKKTSDENARVKVGKLSQPDRDLKSGEATNVRGGGGMPGGVLGDKSDGVGNKLGR